MRCGSRMRAFYLGSACLGAALASAQPAAAQGSGGAASPDAAAKPAESTGNDIIVTATRRDVMLSKVPISVSAFTEKRVDQLGIKNFSDVARFTPGIAISQSNSGNDNIAIRGVSSNAGAATTGGVGAVGAAFFLKNINPPARMADTTNSPAMPATSRRREGLDAAGGAAGASAGGFSSGAFCGSSSTLSFGGATASASGVTGSFAAPGPTGLKGSRNASRLADPASRVGGAEPVSGPDAGDSAARPPAISSRF